MKKNDAKMIQGLSVLAMVCLHLFDSLDYSGLFIPLIYFKGFPLSFYFAQLSDFCVMGYAFCSGYACMTLFDKKHYYKSRLLSLFSLYCNYWIILVSFSLISIAIGQYDSMPKSLSSFIGNFTTLSVSYNGAWWYIKVYAIITLISPIVLKASKKYNSVYILLFSFVLYFVAYWIRFKHSTQYRIINEFGPFGMTFCEYMIGVICCKEKIFEHIEKYVSKIKPIYFYFFSAIVFLALLIGHTLIVRSLFVAPFTGFLIILITKFCKKPIWVEKLLLFFGKHSTNIWLTHMFFFATLFINFVYVAKYPLFIFIFTLIICVLVSYIINLIYNPIKQQIVKHIER